MIKLPKIVIDHSTTILSGLAVAGVVSTVAFAVRATPGAQKKIREAKIVKHDTIESLTEKDFVEPENMKLALLEIVQATWRDYLPAGISGVATIVCILGANQIGLSRNAALLGAYTVVEGAFEQYKDQVVKVIGAKKEAEVVEKVQEERIKENPPVLKEVIITGGGDQLCYDSLSGRYFRGDIEEIRRAENEVTGRILKGDMYASQNELYRLIGLPDAGIGEVLGWCIDNLPKLVFTSHLSLEGIPCLAIEYQSYPRVGYDKF